MNRLELDFQRTSILWGGSIERRVPGLAPLRVATQAQAPALESDPNLRGEVSQVVVGEHARHPEYARDVRERERRNLPHGAEHPELYLVHSPPVLRELDF